MVLANFRHEDIDIFPVYLEETDSVIITPDNEIYIENNEFDSSVLLNKPFFPRYLAYYNDYVFLVTEKAYTINEADYHLYNLYIFTDKYTAYQFSQFAGFQIQTNTLLFYKYEIKNNNDNLYLLRYDLTKLDEYDIPKRYWDSDKKEKVITHGSVTPFKKLLATNVLSSYSRVGGIIVGWFICGMIPMPPNVIPIWCPICMDVDQMSLYGADGISLNYVMHKWYHLPHTEYYTIPANNICGQSFMFSPPTNVDPYDPIALNILASGKTLQVRSEGKIFNYDTTSTIFRGILYQTKYVIPTSNFIILLNDKTKKWEVYQLNKKVSNLKYYEYVSEEKSKEFTIELEDKYLAENTISITVKDYSLKDDGKGKIIDASNASYGYVNYDDAIIRLYFSEKLPENTVFKINYKHYVKGSIDYYFTIDNYANGYLVDNFIENDDFLLIQLVKINNWENLLKHRYKIDTYLKKIKIENIEYNKSFYEILSQIDDEFREHVVLIYDKNSKEKIYEEKIYKQSFRQGLFIADSLDIINRGSNKTTLNQIDDFLKRNGFDINYATKIQNKANKVLVLVFFTTDTTNYLLVGKEKSKYNVYDKIENKHVLKDVFEGLKIKQFAIREEVMDLSELCVEFSLWFRRV